jgi:hypothetical protein
MCELYAGGFTGYCGTPKVGVGPRFAKNLKRGGGRKAGRNSHSKIEKV